MDIGGVVSSFFENAGPGGFAVIVVIGGACLVYYSLARWIVAGGKNDKKVEPDVHSESMHS